MAQGTFSCVLKTEFKGRETEETEFSASSLSCYSSAHTFSADCKMVNRYCRPLQQSVCLLVRGSRGSDGRIRLRAIHLEHAHGSLPAHPATALGWVGWYLDLFMHILCVDSWNEACRLSDKGESIEWRVVEPIGAEECAVGILHAKQPIKLGQLSGLGLQGHDIDKWSGRNVYY